MKTPLAVVDDHLLLRGGLASLLRDMGYSVLFEAGNGLEFQEKLNTSSLPQVVLMDINMPVMDGYETTAWLRKHHPSVKVLVLSMLDDEKSIIRMFRNGAKGYLLKDCEPEELQTAITAVVQKGFYNSDAINGKLIQAVNVLDEVYIQPGPVALTERETQFLHHVCTDLSYKQIAAEMGISARTIENYRETLQEKLDCKGRMGLALWAIKNGVV